MNRNVPLKGLLISFTALALLLFGMVSPAAAQSPSLGNVVLPGHIPAALAHAHPIGRAAPNQRLALSIGLRLRDRSGLDALLKTMYDPRSPGYHHFLTPEQFNAFFAPTARQVSIVEQYLRNAGIQVGSVSPNHLLIDASATVAQAELVFGVQINEYRLGARTVYAPANDPSVPADVAAIVQNIGGLDNVGLYHPLDLLAMAQARQTRPRPTQPFPGPAGGYTPSELRTAYDINPLISAGDQGDSQTVAIFELDGYKSSDITAYDNYYGLSGGSYSNIYVDGFNGSAGSGAIEVELDMEDVTAIAPHAAQLIYEGPNTTQGVNDTYNKIVTDNKAQVMSTSWGECEQNSGNSELQTLDGIFAQGASQGISFFAAAGDSGAYDCGDGITLAVDSPASDPYVTGVGGTTLNTGSGGMYQSESVWSNASQGSGGGGGLSISFSQPSWQTGPGVQNQYSNGMREVPDLSADADPNTGYSIYCTVSAAGCPGSGWTVVGGTSAAAPLWTASTAILNQYLVANGKSRMGFANPTWYKTASNTQTYTPYHDITTGNNLYYPATSGYDLASGWGSPNLYNLARDLAGSGGGSNEGVMTLTPSSMSFSATVGGPNPASQTGTLGNTGTAAYNFTASASTQSGGNWLAVSPTSGSVPVNGNVSLTISVNISGMAAGNYSGTVTATSTNAQGSPKTIAVTLAISSGGTPKQLIVNGGFENGQSPWKEYSAGGYQIIDPTNPHTGNYSAYLCGYYLCTDEIWQNVTLPSTFSQATLTYWFYSDTYDSGSQCYDYFYAQLRTGSGGLIKTVQTSCNANATNQWVEETFNVYSSLSSYKGKTIQVYFKGTTSNSYTLSDFFVDDVSLTVQ
jgi:subtilase family serine protease